MSSSRDRRHAPGFAVALLRAHTDRSGGGKGQEVTFDDLKYQDMVGVQLARSATRSSRMRPPSGPQGAQEQHFLPARGRPDRLRSGTLRGRCALRRGGGPMIGRSPSPKQQSRRRAQPARAVWGDRREAICQFTGPRRHTGPCRSCLHRGRRPGHRGDGDRCNRAAPARGHRRAGDARRCDRRVRSGEGVRHGQLGMASVLFAPDAPCPITGGPPRRAAPSFSPTSLRICPTCRPMD